MCLATCPYCAHRHNVDKRASVLVLAHLGLLTGLEDKLRGQLQNARIVRRCRRQECGC
jgi:hypothetical protein